MGGASQRMLAPGATNPRYATDRKSAIAVQNLLFNLTCDATWRRNRRYVTSGLIKIIIIAYNSETVRDGAKVNINHK